MYNPLFQHSTFPWLSYPSRVERRHPISTYVYRLELHRIAWFHKFPLLDVGAYHAVCSAMLVRWEGANDDLFYLQSRLMGATQSCGIAKDTPWGFMDPIIPLVGVFIIPMVDTSSSAPTI